MIPPSGIKDEYLNSVGPDYSRGHKDVSGPGHWEIQRIGSIPEYQKVTMKFGKDL